MLCNIVQYFRKYQFTPLLVQDLVQGGVPVTCLAYHDNNRRRLHFEYVWCLYCGYLSFWENIILIIGHNLEPVPKRYFKYM